ncbi:MAG: STAS domain-containing protein [Phycisphaerae bacterium]|nr:STAS domain-containing protein [Phycisphaerae bacterium]
MGELKMGELKIDTAVISAARAEGSAVIAEIRGDIDLHNSPDLRSAILQMLQQAKPTKLILNVTQVPYMDSSAIAVLVESLRKMRACGGKLFLIGPQPRVKSVLEIARLDTLFFVVNDEAAALNAK